MELIHEIDAHDGGTGAVAFAPDSRTLLTGGGDYLIKIWSPDTWTVTGALAGHTGDITCLTFSPDGQQLASGSADTTSRLWGWPSGELHASLTGHDGPVSDLDYFPDGTLLISASLDTTARIWSIEHAAEVGIHMKHPKSIAAARFTPDGGAILTAGVGPPIHMWLLPEGKWIATLKTAQKMDAHQMAVGALAISRSQAVMASGGWDGQVALWGIPGWAHEKSFRATGLGVHALDFHPSDRFVAASSDDEVVIADLESGKRVAETKVDVKGIPSLQFSPDGTLLVAACADGKIRVWDASTLG